MPVELAVGSLEGSIDSKARIDEVLGLINAQGLGYRSTSNGVCIEDEWDNVMAFIDQLNVLSSRSVARQSPLVFTLRVPFL